MDMDLDLDLNQGNFHPVELVQRDHDGKKLEWKELASYANFKGFIGYCS